jgi:hypothetical protein
MTPFATTISLGGASILGVSRTLFSNADRWRYVPSDFSSSHLENSVVEPQSQVIRGA